MAGLEHLLGHVTDYASRCWNFRRDDKFDPIELRVDEAKLTFSYRPNGAVEIKLPVPFNELPEKEDYLLKRTEKGSLPALRR